MNGSFTARVLSKRGGDPQGPPPVVRYTYDPRQRLPFATRGLAPLIRSFFV